MSRDPLWLKWVLTAVLGLAAWGGVTLINQGERITKVEQRAQDINDALLRIEQKLDYAIWQGQHNGH